MSVFFKYTYTCGL